MAMDSVVKLRPSDGTIWTQQVTSLLGATFCTRLATLLQRVATCCDSKIELMRMPWRNNITPTWPKGYNIMQHHPQMWHEKFDYFQIRVNNTQHVATRRKRVAKRTQHVAPNNVAIRCVEMLRSFGWGITSNEIESRGNKLTYFKLQSFDWEPALGKIPAQ